MYVYVRSEPQLWTVGFYSPDGQWHAESDHDSAKEAAQRVRWLNGGVEVVWTAGCECATCETLRRMDAEDGE
jgi:hypothetical protein